ncbi:hypothetical protein [Galbibacter sp. BG1]
MKQLTYLNSATAPEDKGVIWVKHIFSPLSTEQRYFSPVTGEWELITSAIELEMLTNRLNAFGTINPDEIKPNLGFEKGVGNTDYNNLEVGDIKVNEVYPNTEGKHVIGLLICTDLSPETWQPFGSADQINQ